MMHHQARSFREAIEKQRYLEHNPLGSYLAACAEESALFNILRRLGLISPCS